MVVVAGLGMTAKTKSNGVRQVGWASLRFLDDMVYVDVASDEVMADATTAMGTDESLFSDSSGETHIGGHFLDRACITKHEIVDALQVTLG